MKIERQACLLKFRALVLGAVMLIAPSVVHAAEDLVVDGQSVTLSGEQSFGAVTVRNGGSIVVNAYNGTPGTGSLTLKANSISIDATSSINGDGKGYRGISNGAGEGPGGGTGGTLTYDTGGGGGYGGPGGNGVRDSAGPSGPFDGLGGPAYGTLDGQAVELGSAGGAAGGRDGDWGGYGGSGGGAIRLEAGTITNAGTISANGADGLLYNNDSSGGGSGGGILIIAGQLANSGTIRANGGSGGHACGWASCGLDDGGGGGGGGRIKIFHGTMNNSGAISAAGGPGARYGQAGATGTIYAEGSECVAPPADLVGWWPGDGNANDIVGKKNGTAVGGAAFGQGRVAQGFTFDGTGRVAAADFTALDAAQALTLDAWVNFQGIGQRSPAIANSPIVAKWGDTLYGTASYGLFIDENGYPILGLSRTGSSLDVRLKAPSPIAKNTPALVAGVWTGSQAQLFVNGELVASAAFTGPLHAIVQPLLIGGYDRAYTSGSDSLIGMVDEVEAFSRALSAAEIRALYYAGGAGKCKNRPPVAEAGASRKLECSSPSGAVATLDGSGSSDPDGDALTYAWTWDGGNASGVSPSVTLPLGTHAITLTVDDGKGGTATDTVTIVVADTTPPTTTVRSISGITGNNGWYTSDVLVTVDSTDSCSGVRDIRSSVDGNAATTPGNTASISIRGDGSHGVSYNAVDNAGNVEQPKTLTVNIDKTAPSGDISVAPGLLWPPNHKLTDVLVSGGSADATSGIDTVVFTVTDEYGTVQPQVSGFDTAIPLEAWREGTDTDGRHYTITAVITDKAGNQSTVSTEAVCPHDMRDKQ